jgi:hypothetical protein
MQTIDLSLLLGLFKATRFGSLQIIFNNHSVIFAYLQGSGTECKDTEHKKDWQARDDEHKNR